MSASLRRHLRLPSAARPLAPAVLVGTVVRLAWAVWARTPAYSFDNPEVHNLSMAAAFADLHLPTAGGAHSGFFSLGYPLLLLPAGLAAKAIPAVPIAGWAVALNVVASSWTVGGLGLLAGRWFGAAAARPAAWIVALAPPLVLVVPVVSSATVFLAVSVLALLAAVPAAGTPRLAAAGAAAGVATVISPAGVLVAPMVWLLCRAHDPVPDRRSLRPLVVGAGAPLLLLAVWSGLEVGAWTPVPTQVAGIACLGHGTRPITSWEVTPPVSHPACYRSRLFRPETAITGNPRRRMDQEPSEAAWFRSTLGRSVWDTVRNPPRTAAQVAAATWDRTIHPGAPLSLAEDLGAQPLSTPRFHVLTLRVLLGWQLAVLFLAGLALWSVGTAARRMGAVALLAFSPVWVGPTPGASALVALSLACVLAGAFVAAVRTGSEQLEAG